jgi:hypothetical protein
MATYPELAVKAKEESYKSLNKTEGIVASIE